MTTVPKWQWRAVTVHRDRDAAVSALSGVIMIDPEPHPGSPCRRVFKQVTTHVRVAGGVASLGDWLPSRRRCRTY